MSEFDRKAVFLRAYRTSCREGADDRLAAAEEAGVAWAEVELWLAEDADFQKRYDEIWREGFIAIEDRTRARARAGDRAAGPLVLKKEDPEGYGQKVKVQVDVSGQVRIGRADVDGMDRSWLYNVLEGEVIGQHALLPGGDDEPS